MKIRLLLFLLITIFLTSIILSFQAQGISNSNPAPIQNIFMQGNNINTAFRTDGIFNRDWIPLQFGEAGMIWPVTSPNRKTINYTTGIWIGAKVILPNNQKELRVAACMFSSHFTPGNIPVVGQVPPQSVCNDPKWRGYYVQLTDPSLVNGGTRVKIAGGRQYTFNYDAWSLWPVNLGAPFVEVNGIAGYQPGWNADRPGIGNGSNARPDELLFMTFMDFTNCTNNIHESEIGQPGGSLPMGVEVHMLSFMFNCQGYKDMYFMKWKIINKSGRLWDSTYFAVADDIDIGDGTASARDDAVGCDTTRSMGFIYNCDNNDANYGVNPPACGIRLLQSPVRFTGNQYDTAKLPYDTLIGYKLLSMTTFIVLTENEHLCLTFPDNAEGGYNFMRGVDKCNNPRLNPITHQQTTFSYSGDACNRAGWFDSVCIERALLMSSGPFVMNSLDTQIAVMACIVGFGSNNYQNVCNLQASSDSALKYYYQDFMCNSAIGIEPISSNVPERYALYQNYPNPFNPVTKIKFDVPAVSVGNAYMRSLQLAVYDILGREVIVLVNEPLKPGTYEIEWDATAYSSGLYLYRLESNDYSETKKMLLLK